MLGSLLAELLVDYTYVRNNLTILFYMSWISVSLAFVACAMLPLPARESPESLAKMIYHKKFNQIKNLIKSFYMNPIVFVWSVWWIAGYVFILCLTMSMLEIKHTHTHKPKKILAFGSYNVYENYYQNLIYNANNNANFGLILATIEISSVIGSFIIILPLSKNFWIKNTNIITIIFSICICLVLIIPMIFNQSSIITVLMTVLLFGIYQSGKTTAFAVIGFALTTHNYALVLCLFLFFLFSFLFAYTHTHTHGRTHIHKHKTKTKTK